MAQVIQIQLTDLHNALSGPGASYQFEGEDFGEVPLSFFWTDAPPGTGPRLHQHPYPEVFVIIEGQVRFTVGDDTLNATAGQIVIAPPGCPHAFVNAGSERSCHLDIHPTGRMNRPPIDAGSETLSTQRIPLCNLPCTATSHRFDGFAFGGIPMSFFWTDGPAGTGPKLHRHPYAEVFVVQQGHLAFTVGDETIEATGGQVVIAPAGQPHKFVNAGPGRARHFDIHASERMITEWLES